MTSELPDAAPEPSDIEPEGKSRWSLPGLSTKAKWILGVGTVVIIVIGYFILQRLLPDWWGTRMGNRIDRSFTSGTLWGLFYGIIGSAIPLLLWLLAVLWINKGPKRIASWVMGVVGLLLLIPNLLTLAIVVGTGQGSRAGRLQLDMFGPGFRGATLVGVIIGIVLGVAVDFYLLGRRRAKRRAVSSPKSIDQTRQ
ncbi:permease [Gordonia humi]|uniref:Putative membrane protein n=1 Tax=Gordonia humi TaxID=686429 RepID=A0A840F3N7_9ACTN|nr:permease [Gordonia humi]MBB4134197.1 putative membrane protein [Gordonia humi]